MAKLMPLSLHHLLLHQNPDWFNVSGADVGCPGTEAVKRVSYIFVSILYRFRDIISYFSKFKEGT